MKAADFENLCNSVRQSASSLRSCREFERVNESNILRATLNQLLAAKLDRKSDRLHSRRVEMMHLANSSLATHGA